MLYTSLDHEQKEWIKWWLYARLARFLLETWFSTDVTPGSTAYFRV